MFRIPVCRCGIENCAFSYTRVLPDGMVPHKHYCAEVIENVIDEVCTPEDIQTEDYPCEKTMDEWKAWIAGNRDHINGVLRSVGSRLSVFGEELLKTEDSLMDKLREDGGGWLSILISMAWNFGMPFFNARWLKTVSTDSSVVSEKSGLLYFCKEESNVEKQRSDVLAGRNGSKTIRNSCGTAGSGSGQGEKDRAP